MYGCYLNNQKLCKNRHKTIMNAHIRKMRLHVLKGVYVLFHLNFVWAADTQPYETSNRPQVDSPRNGLRRTTTRKSEEINHSESSAPYAAIQKRPLSTWSSRRRTTDPKYSVVIPVQPTNYPTWLNYKPESSHDSYDGAIHTKSSESSAQKMEDQIENRKDNEFFIQLVDHMLTKSHTLVIATRPPNETVCGAHKDKYQILFENPETIHKLCKDLENYSHVATSAMSSVENYGHGESTDWSTRQKMIRTKNAGAIDVSHRDIVKHALILLEYQKRALELNNQFTEKDEKRIPIGKVMADNTYIPSQLLLPFLQLLRYHNDTGITNTDEWAGLPEVVDTNPYKEYVNAHSSMPSRKEFWRYVSVFGEILKLSCSDDPLRCARSAFINSFATFKDTLNLHIQTIPPTLDDLLKQMIFDLKNGDLKHLKNFPKKYPKSGIERHCRHPPTPSKEATAAGAQNHAMELVSITLQLVEEAHLASRCADRKCAGLHKPILISVHKEDQNKIRKSSDTKQLKESSSKISEQKDSSKKQKKQTSKTSETATNSEQSHSIVRKPSINMPVTAAVQPPPNVLPAIAQSIAARKEERRKRSSAVKDKQTGKDMSNDDEKRKELEKLFKNQNFMNRLTVLENKKESSQNLLRSNMQKTSARVRNNPVKNQDVDEIDWSKYDEIMSTLVSTNLTHEAIKLAIEAIAEEFGDEVTNPQLALQLQKHMLDYEIYGRMAKTKENENARKIIKLIKKITSDNNIYRLIFTNRLFYHSICKTEEHVAHYLRGVVDVDNEEVFADFCEFLGKMTHLAEKMMVDEAVMNMDVITAGDADPETIWLTRPQTIANGPTEPAILMTPHHLMYNSRIALEVQHTATAFMYQFAWQNSSERKALRNDSDLMATKTYIVFFFLPTYLQLIRYLRIKLNSKDDVSHEIWKTIVSDEPSKGIENAFKFAKLHSPNKLPNQKQFKRYVVHLSRIHRTGYGDDPLHCAADSIAYSIEILQDSLKRHFKVVPVIVDRLLEQIKVDLNQRNFEHSDKFQEIYPKKVIHHYFKALPELSDEAAAAGADVHAKDLLATALQLIEEAHLASQCFAGRCGLKHAIPSFEEQT